MSDKNSRTSARAVAASRELCIIFRNKEINAIGNETISARVETIRARTMCTYTRSSIWIVWRAGITVFLEKLLMFSLQTRARVAAASPPSLTPFCDHSRTLCILARLHIARTRPPVEYAVSPDSLAFFVHG